MNLWSKRVLAVTLALLLIFIDVPRWVLPTDSVAEASVAVSFAGGSGVVGDPYLIESAEQLDAMRWKLDGHYRLIANIDLSGYHANGGWTPIGSATTPFTGSMNGAIGGDEFGEAGSYQISKLYMDNSVIDEEKAFIHTIGSTGLIAYIDFVDVDLQTGAGTAVLAVTNNGAVTHVDVTGNIISDDNDVAGIVVYNGGAMSAISFTGHVEGADYVGGIIGFNDGGSLDNAINNGTVIGKEKVGGLIGRQTGGVFNNGEFNGTVTGVEDVGGAVGYVNNASSIVNILTTGSVKGEVSVGGLVGDLNDSSVTMGSAHTDVNGIQDVGGLVGSNDDGEISQSTASSTVIGEEDVGGLVGDNDGIVTMSSATGSVAGQYSVGGLVGDNDNNEISNSYANGDVTGTDEVGGLVGSNIDGSITNSYSIGVVNGTSFVGGLVGFNVEYDSEGIVTNSYYDLDTSRQQDSEKGLGLSTVAMKLVTSYVGWDFDTIWKMDPIHNYSYPYLQKSEKFLTYSSNGEQSSENLYDSKKYDLFNDVLLNDNSYGWSRQGFTFNGWNTESNGTGDHYAANDPMRVSKDTVLYAEWKSNAPVYPIEPPSNVLSSNADLAVLELRNGEEWLTLAPVFHVSKVSYSTTTIATELELKAQPVDASASVSYGQQTIISPIKLDLQLGDNIVTLLVRAANGTEKRYTVTITRVAEEPVDVCPFTDLVGHWAMADICEASRLSIVEGVDSTLFVPNAAITRTEATALLLRALGIEAEVTPQELNFSDSGEIPAWARDIIATSVTKDIVRGYPNGTFRPDQIITRAELTALVARAMKWESNTAGTLPFKDNTTIPTWATGYVYSAYTRDLIEGRASELFDPNGIATRAEAAVMMLRLWKLNQQL